MYNTASSHTNLRPLKLGELLDSAILAFARLLPRLLGVLLLITVFEQIRAQTLDSMPLLLRLVTGVVGFVLPLMVGAMVARMAAADRFGTRMTAWEALKGLSVSRLWGLALLYVWLLAMTILGFLCLIIPGVHYSVTRLLAIPIYVIEEGSMRDALWRSRFLMTRGKWYSPASPMMRVSVVMFIILVVVSSLSIGEGARDYFGWGAGVAGVGSLIIGTALSLFTQILTSVSTVVYVTFYFDLRARYEGLDLLVDLEALESALPPISTAAISTAAISTATISTATVA